MKRSVLSENQKYRILAILLTCAVLIQGAYLLRHFGPELLAIRGTIGQNGLWRSANFYQNLRFANYVNYLNGHIAEDARVVLAPVKSGPKILGITPFMQFFLAPREVINCPDEECLDNLSMDNTYVVFTDAALVTRLVDSPEQVWMFDDGWGVVAPKGVSSEAQIPVPGFASLFDIVLAALWPILWLLLMAVAGTLVVARLVHPRGHVLVIFVLGYGFALAVFSLSAAAVSLAGVPLGRDTIIWITATLLFAALVFFFIDRRYGRSTKNAPTESFSKSVRLDPWQAVFLVLGGFAYLISVGKAYHSTDAILLWGAKGYGIAAAGTIMDVTAWGTNTVPYPLNIPVLIGALKILFTDSLPASKLIFSGYYIGLMLIMYHTLSWFGVRRAIGGLATLLVGMTPIIFRQATIGYANLAMSFHLAAAVFLLAKSLEDSKSPRAYRAALLSGFFFAFAAWTRPEALALSGLTIALIFGITYIKRRDSFPIRGLLYVVIPLLVYGSFWLLIKDQVYAQGAGKTDLGEVALRGILSGNLHLGEAFYILRTFLAHLLDFKTWGLLGLALIIVLLASLIISRGRQPFTGIALWSGFLVVVMILGVYYLASYDTVHDISWWVNTGLDRMVLPGIVLLWVGGISGIKLFYDHK